MAFLSSFGQYVQANTVVHRLDARLKLLLLAAYLAGLFMIQGAWCLALYVAILVALYLLARVNLRLALRGLKPLIVILAFTLLANALSFSLPAGAPPSGQGIALIGSFGISPAGLERGLFLTIRIIALFSASSLLTYTTPLVDLSDALVKLLRPLARLRVPTEDIAMMFSIALRFIPLTAAEAERIMVAQSTRGARFDTGGPLARVRAWVPVLVPLFVRLFRRADTLAAAMESRCYSGQRRTHLASVRPALLPILAALALAAALITGGVLF